MNTKLLFAAALLALIMSGPALAGGDAARGQELAAECADCHGADGMGDEDNPKLAGLDEAYHIEQLQAFKSGARTDEDEMMLMYVEELSDQDMADLAAYFASLGGN